MMTHQPISWSCAQDDSYRALHIHHTCSPMSICAVDCKVQGDVPSSPAGLLRSITRGAYTALRADGPDFKVPLCTSLQSINCVHQEWHMLGKGELLAFMQVVGLQEHLQRLGSSLICILDREAYKELVITCRHWLSADTGAHQESLWNTIGPTVRTAGAAAKRSNPDSSIWMVVLHLCVVQVLAGET